MNRSVAISLATLALLVAAPTAEAQVDPTPPVPSGPDPSTPVADAPMPGTITMELVDQTFDLAPDGTIELTFHLTGDLAGVADIAPPTTTTPTTTTASPSTTAAPTEGPADTGPVRSTDPQIPPAAEAPAGTTTETGTTTPVATTPVTSDPTATTDTTPATSAPAVDEPPPPPALTAQVFNYAPLDDSDDLDGWLGPDPPVGRRALDGIDLPEVRSMITVESPTLAVLELSVATDRDPSISEKLKFDSDGVHPVIVELSVDGRIVARNGTVVERRSDATTTPPPVDLAIIASIDDPGPIGTDADYADAVDRFAGLVGDASSITAGLTFAVPPSVVTAAIDDGTIDLSDADLLADDVLLAAPATPFDVSSAVEVDRVDAFTRQLGAGEDDIAAALGKFPSRDVWAVTDELSGPAAQVLRDLGVRYLAMTADVYLKTVADDPAGDVPALDRFIDLPLPDGGRMPVLVIDEEFGSAFTTEATDAVLADTTAFEWAISTVAGLRIDQYAAPSAQRRDRRSHLLAVPGLGAFDPRLVNALEGIADTTEAIRFRTAPELASNTSAIRPSDDVRLPDTAGPSLADRLQQIAAVDATLDAVASMLPGEDERSAAWDRELDSFVSTAYDDATVAARLDELVSEAATIRNGVRAPEPFTFTLTGSSGDITIPVGNRLDEPVDVVLRLSSPRLDFPDGDVTVRLAPDDVTSVKVPVVARSNGTSAVTVEILTPSFDQLTDPVTLTSRVNALTGLGQVLTVGFVLVLATWWFSHWRSRRRSGPATAAELATDE